MRYPGSAETDDPHDRSKWNHAQWAAYQEGWHTGKEPERPQAAQCYGNLSTRQKVAYDDGKFDAIAQLQVSPP